MEFTDGDDCFSNVPLENTLTPAPGRRFIEPRGAQASLCGGIMGSFKSASAALMAVSALAGFAVLLGVSPAMAVGPPTLTPSSATVHAGDPITFDGSGFDACTNLKTSATPVLLLWNGQNPVDVAGSNGSFSLPTTVPNASPGTYRVTAQCYDPASGKVTSHFLAVAGVQIVALPPTLQLSSSQSAPGQVVTATGDGFGQCVNGAANEIDLLWDSAPLGQPRQADATGHFSTEVSVPADAPAGTVHAVGAECFDPVKGPTSGILASSQLTVIAASPSPSQSSTLSPSPSSTASQGTGTSQSPVNSQSPGLPGTSGASSAPPATPSSLGSGSSHSSGWVPVALIGGTGGGLLLAALLLAAGLHFMHAAQRRRGAAWTHEHLRVAVGTPESPSATVHGRPSAMSLSLGLEPHADQQGNQELRGDA